MKAGWVLLVAGCAREAPPALPAGPAGDTLRGMVERVGAEPAGWLVIRGIGGRPDVVLVGGPAWLPQLAGTEVMVRGVRVPEGFRVDGAAVRAVDGVPATDGVVARDGDGWALVQDDGRRVPVPHLPGLLRRAGLRVWLVGPLDRPPPSFGVVAEGPHPRS